MLCGRMRAVETAVAVGTAVAVAVGRGDDVTAGTTTIADDEGHQAGLTVAGETTGEMIEKTTDGRARGKRIRLPSFATSKDG